jgi:eukaryotic-like serine/threonine-protein kinase
MSNSDQSKSEQDDSSSEELELFDTLDRYVEYLNRGDEDSVQDLSSKNLDSSQFFQCLNSLDKLSPVMPKVDQIPVLNIPENEKEADENNSEGDRDEFEMGMNTKQFPCKFGGYELLEEIGRGGMGVVFKARQTNLGREIALKMILSSRFASREQIHRFYTEAKTAGKLKHPHIVGIHEVGEIHGQHYFTMDLVNGKNLNQLFKEGPVPAEEAALILQKIADAVHYLHGNQIIHRDLKPSNILLDEEGNPYVSDFGLAKIMDYDGDATQSGSILGTPSYMPPEQAAGHLNQISERSDIYSLGAILYSLLTGRPPFSNDNPLDTLVDVLESEPALPTDVVDGIPRELSLICMKCLEKEPEKRYQTAAELVADLERFLCGDPVEAKPAGVIHSLHRWMRREPALATRLTGLVLAAVIIQITYWKLGTNIHYHTRIMTVFGCWFIWALFCQWVLADDRLSKVICYLWAISDIAFLTGLLFITESPLGPLLIGYPFLIVASGLFFDVKVVWTSTFFSLIGYAILMRLRIEESNPPQYPIIFAAVMALLGMVVAYQVHRTRLLSRYFKQNKYSSGNSSK